ncbi:RidA family protein [Pseudomonas azotoformans]|uniref:Translation initiation inhibitor n=1 Tax=Pseudomonas azotoformans TaxID=47878 RepID=A0A127I3M3_PSEAZ|nr:RidA family protein [Pseudomonas azotoformans]AMN81406.1 translation initiation inhibitor [Pseudomonas azotoformans]
MSTQTSIYKHGVAWEEGHGVAQGYSVNGTIFISGQFSHTLEGEFVDGDAAAQTRKTLENLDHVLAGFGIGRNNLAAVDIFLVHAKRDFDAVVAVWKDYIGTHRPAATLVGVNYLASDAQIVEIKAVAHAD